MLQTTPQGGIQPSSDRFSRQWRVRYLKVNLRSHPIINRIITTGLPRNLPCESRLDKQSTHADSLKDKQRGNQRVGGSLTNWSTLFINLPWEVTPAFKQQLRRWLWNQRDVSPDFSQGQCIQTCHKDFTKCLSIVPFPYILSQRILPMNYSSWVRDLIPDQIQANRE
jgi:hypothetical protein